MRIGLDVCGGDYAPDVCVKGALLALSELNEDDTLVLFGNKGNIDRCLKEFGGNDATGLEIVHCEDVILMDDVPTKAFVGKPDSTIAVGFRYLQDGMIDSFASAGNTGAMLVGTKYTVGLIDGVLRPCIGSIMPKEYGGYNFFLDVGTNPDVKPEILEQFAMLGYTFVKNVYGIDNPKVALLNIGEEEGKGSVVVQAAYNLMKENRLIDFVGNLEGRDMFSDKANVFVCDGFVGNVILKFTESIYDVFKRKDIVDDFVRRLNYENYGGLPLLGANGIIMIGHGISSEIAIKNMLLQSRKCYEVDIVEKLRSAING